MRWNAEITRVTGVTYGEIELWEMQVSHVESALKYARKALEDHTQGWNVPPGPGQPYYERWAFVAWWSVCRKLRLAVGMLDRELTYRRDPDYRALAAAVRKTRKDMTAKLILADRCDELGYHVMARRLRRIVAGTPTKRRSRMANTRHRR